MRKRLTRKQRAAYKRHCKMRYYSILLAYFLDFCNKMYLVSLPWLIKYKLVPEWLIQYVTPAAIVGVIIDFAAKWYMLKNMKMRKRGYYDIH